MLPSTVSSTRLSVICIVTINAPKLTFYINIKVSECVLCPPTSSNPHQPPLLVPDGRCRLSGPAECAINFGERAVWESNTSSRRGAARPADYLGQRAPCLPLKLPLKHNAASCWRSVTPGARAIPFAVRASINPFHYLWLSVLCCQGCHRLLTLPLPPHPPHELLPTEQVLTGSWKLASGSFNCRCGIPA